MKGLYLSRSVTQSLMEYLSSEHEVLQAFALINYGEMELAKYDGTEGRL